MAEGGDRDEKHNMPPPPYKSIYPEMPEDISDNFATINGKSRGSNECDVSLIIKAVDLAARRHRQQRRKDTMQTPYINHPIGVAYILTNEGQITDTATILAAILHDIIEDTKTTDEEIRKTFGDEVADIVKECTVIKSMKREARMKSQLEKAAKLSHKASRLDFQNLLNISLYRAKLVQLADKLYNIRDIERGTPVGWTKQQVTEYIAFAKDLLSNIRGIHGPLEIALDDIINKHIK
uniref:Guanosine-3',5'-bis(diphosphate) 3'-pyrophosphohydrolase MESH1 n=1 Tax=Elaeophora elaphi TaxID=1147741 RepID=A0A0R3S5F8_9BILA